MPSVDLRRLKSLSSTHGNWEAREKGIGRMKMGKMCFKEIDQGSVVFSRGDEVVLTKAGVEVAIGIVQKCAVNDTVQRVALKEDHIGVFVDSVIENCQLPYPTSATSEMSIAIDSCIIWDAFLAYLKGSTPSRTENEGNTGFSEGDEVDLLLFGDVVAQGVLLKTRPSDSCHNKILGVGRFSVRVTNVIDVVANIALPYPHAGAETLLEALQSWVIWDSSQLLKRDDNSGRAPCASDDHFGVGNSTRNILPISTKDFSKRSNWMSEDVTLFSPDRSQEVAKGVISLPFETGPIDNEILGDDHVGVAVKTVLVSSYFPDIHPGVPALVKWSLHCTKLHATLKFIGDMLEDAVKEGGSPEGSFLNPTLVAEYDLQKRPYNYIKRTKMDPAEKQRRLLATKAEAKSTEASIDELMQTLCCKRKCCILMPKIDSMDVRREFQGMSSNDKTSHILNLLHSREEKVKQQGLFILKGRIVCWEAFHEIHGFSQSKFYDYTRKADDGYKVGFHGNKGLEKTRGNTMMARAFLEAILKENGEPMPHLSYGGDHGTDNIEYRLPSCYSRKEIFNEVSMKMSLEGLDVVIEGTLYDIWRNNFANFLFHKQSAFAKCTLCVQFKDSLMREKRKAERANLEARRATHLREQMSRRQAYYSHRVLAKKNPEDYICIIHDKMDPAKTWIPRLVNLPKSLSRVGQPLPVALTGMLTHGRDPGAFAHFSLTGLWPRDADFIVSSLARCLRDLEVYSGDKSGDLQEGLYLDSGRPIFDALLDFEAFNNGYMEPKGIVGDKFCGMDDGAVNIRVGRRSTHNHDEDDENSDLRFSPLPKHLTLQMDNSGKDSKNQMVLAFCSNLVGRGVFETIQLSFLMVGHTHEDVDALFSQVSKRLKSKEVATLQALMAKVWECQADHQVPRFMQEVASYKEYIQSFHVKEIEGHSKPVAFLFSMRDNIPIYQYKFHVKQPWLPVTGRCIWNTSAQEAQSILFPLGDPSAKPVYQFHKKAEDIIPFLNHYIDFLKPSCADRSSVAYQERFPLLRYWERVVDNLSRDLAIRGEGNNRFPLKYGFWPKTNQGTGYRVHRSEGDASHVEDTIQNAKMIILQDEYSDEMREQAIPFVGARSEREPARWTPLTDIREGHFVFLRPEDEWETTNGAGYFWLVRALSVVDANHPIIPPEGTPPRLAPMFQVEWWRLKHVQPNADDSARYKTCFMPTKTWERDPGFAEGTEYWQFANSAIYGFKSAMKDDNIVEKGLRIPKKVLDAIKMYMTGMYQN